MMAREQFAEEFEADPVRQVVERGYSVVYSPRTRQSKK